MSDILESFEQPDASGRTVVSHLSGLVLRFAERKPVDALENFEQYSLKSKHPPHIPHPDSESPEENVCIVVLLI